MTTKVMNPLATKSTRNWSAVIMDRPPLLELVPESIVWLADIVPFLSEIRSTD